MKRKNFSTSSALLLAFLLVSSLAITAVSAQGPDNPPPPPPDNSEPNEAAAEGERPFTPTTHFRHITTSDGLPLNDVEVILQDSNGFIWVGTSDGLSRYDGYTFTTYKHQQTDPNSMGHNHVRTLTEDAAGNIWIGTEGGGIARLNPHTGEFTRYQHNPDDPGSVGNDIIFSSFADSRGDLWFGSLPQGSFNRFDPQTERFTRYNPGNSEITAGAGWDIMEDADGVIWFISDNWLQRYDPSTDEFAAFAVQEGERRLGELVQDENGRFWLGGSTGLYSFDPQTEEMTHHGRFGSVHSLLFDENGRLWVGTNGNGVVLFDPQTGSIIQRLRHDTTNPLSLSSDNITTLFKDDAGLIWVGTSDRGINLYNPAHEQFAHYQHQPLNSNSLAAPQIVGLDGDNAGNLWVINDETLNQINLSEAQVTRYPVADMQLPGNPDFNAVLHDSRGLVWLALSDAQMVRLNPATGEAEPMQLRELPPTPDNRPRPPAPMPTMFEDVHGNIWVAGKRDALYRIDARDGTVQAFEAPPPQTPREERQTFLAAAQINALTGDADGNIWVGYEFGELSRLDVATGQFTHYFPNSSGNPGGYVEDLLVDSNGRIWLATREGLTRFDPQTETFTQFTDGFPTTFITAVLEDDQGMLWIATKHGLVQFDPQTESVIRTYTAADGLQGDEFNRGAWQDENGRLYFGGTNGITTFHPATLGEETFQPPVVFTNLRMANVPVAIGSEQLAQPVWETDELVFDYDDDIMTFDFAALSYANPEQTKYRYQLEGFEDGWNEVDSDRHFATYTNLPAGRYTLRVQAGDDNGIWSEQEASLAVTITPPFWETWWFLVLMTGLGLLAIALGVRWRLQSVQKRNEELETQVAVRTQELAEAKERAEVASHAKSEFLANMSHELRTPLNGILGYAQILRRDVTITTMQRDGLNTIYNSGRHLLTLINDVLDLAKIEARRLEIHPAELALMPFLQGIVDMMQMAARQKDIRLLFEPNTNLPAIILADEKRLRQVLLNLLGNAIKFTEVGSVTFVVTANWDGKERCQLRFEIVDTGVGMAPDQLAQIFQPFEQVGDASYQAAGTGLGLPISQRLVRLMGGEIMVSSTSNEGSHFWFDVDMVVLAETVVSPNFISQLITGYEGERRRVLVVDDRPENRMVLLNMLEPLGFAVFLAENGKEAVDSIQEVNPDIILMDLVMPVMMGFDAVAAIRKMPAFAHLPIIAVSASVLEMDKEDSKRVGCDDFLTKPVDVDKLLALFQQYLHLTWQVDTLGASERMDGMDTAVSPPNPIIPPPRDQLEIFVELARFGNMTRIRTQAQQLVELSPQYQPFAAQLIQLADDFEDEQILAFVVQFLEMEE